MELKDYQKILGEKARRAEAIFDKYPEQAADCKKDFVDLNNQKIKRVEPEIMVYGIYNAGKSSILNELIGEDKAKVEDKPTTDVVKHYDWQGYKIADTPGVFAPIKHEEVTQRHLKKADVVLFVMSTTGSFDRLENYQRMKAIADAGKKIIIVLNDKNGDMGSNDEAIRQIKQKVAANMDRLGITDVDEKYSMIAVNADFARTGRLENDDELIEMSGINELKAIIINELKRTTSFEVLRNGISELEKILDRFVGVLEGRENSEAVQKMNGVLSKFNLQKISMRRDINSYIDLQTDKMGSTLPTLIWDRRGDKSAVDEIINREQERLNKRVQAKIQEHLEEAATILQSELKLFSEVRLNAQGVDSGSVKNIFDRLATSESAVNVPAVVPEKDFMDQMVESLDLEKQIKKQAQAAVIDFAEKNLLKKFGVKKAVEKFIGAPLPGLGQALMIYDGLKALLGDNSADEARMRAINEANAREQRRVEIEKQARHDLAQNCRYMADNFADALKESSNRLIADVLDKYEAPFKEEIAKRKISGDRLADDIVKLRALKDEYDLLRVELGAR